MLSHKRVFSLVDDFLPSVGLGPGPISTPDASPGVARRNQKRGGSASQSEPARPAGMTGSSAPASVSLLGLNMDANYDMEGMEDSPPLKGGSSSNTSALPSPNPGALSGGSEMVLGSSYEAYGTPLGTPASLAAHFSMAALESDEGSVLGGGSGSERGSIGVSGASERGGGVPKRRKSKDKQRMRNSKLAIGGAASGSGSAKSPGTSPTEADGGSSSHRGSSSSGVGTGASLTTPATSPASHNLSARNVIRTASSSSNDRGNLASPGGSVGGFDSKLEDARSRASDSSSSSFKSTISDIQPNNMRPTLPANVCIVGQELGGVILIAYDKPNRSREDLVTVIDMYTLDSRERTPLYEHNTVIEVVGASVNHERTLLAFTTFSEGSLYDSWMVEIQPQATISSFKIRCENYQHVQFIPSPAVQKGSSWIARARSFTSSFLYIVDTEFIVLYSVSLRQRDAEDEIREGLKMYGQPVQDMVLARNNVWYEWNPKKRMLYYLVPRNYTGAATHVFHGYLFEGYDGTPRGLAEHMFAVPITLSIPTDVCYLNRQMGSESLPSLEFAIRPVTMRGGVVCLCTQVWKGYEIDVTIHLFHDVRRLEFTIPLNMSSEAAKATRVLFTTLADFLVVYIPGHYLQLIDCGCDHEPCRGIIVTGTHMTEELTSPYLSNVGTANQPVCLAPFELIAPEPIDIDYPDLRGHFFVNCFTGEVFELSLNRSTIRALFDDDNPRRLLVAALHLIVIHLHDQELLTRVMVKACGRRSATVDLFKEYLIGCPYQAMRERHGSRSQVLPHLPLTSTPSFSEEGGDVRRDLLNFKFTTLVGETVPRADGNKRLTAQTLRTQYLAESTVAAGDNQTGVRKLFSGLFTQRNAPTANPEPEEEEENSSHLIGPAYAQVLAERLAPPRNMANELSVEYETTQLEAVNQLFSHVRLVQEIGHVSEFAFFEVFEALYTACEELRYPLPTGFSTEFSMLGFRTLPRTLFLQYIERGIFKFTPKSVGEVGEALVEKEKAKESADAAAETEEEVEERVRRSRRSSWYERKMVHMSGSEGGVSNVDLLFHLSAEVDNREKANFILLQYPEYHEYLGYFYSQFLNKTPKTPRKVLPARIKDEHKDFYPLGVLMEHFDKNNEKGVSLEFVSALAAPTMLDILDIPAVRERRLKEKEEERAAREMAAVEDDAVLV